MRIAAVVQGFGFGRGRATTAVELIAPLAAAGHDVTVFTTAVAPRVPEVAGVPVRAFREWSAVARYDVVIYNSGLAAHHLDAVRKAAGLGARLLMCQHSYNSADAGLLAADKVWFPSRAAMRASKTRGHDRFVVPPPIDPDRYRTAPGTKIGLSLSSPWKGGGLVANLARALPQHKFLVIRDPRGNGVRLFKGLSNVELRGFMDPRDFFAQTRVHLFPSQSETYGRVAVEGAISGIPLVASPCEGIQEAMQGHGIFLPRQLSAVKWMGVVDRLMRDQAYWKQHSRDVAIRGGKMTYRADQEAFRGHVEAMA